MIPSSARRSVNSFTDPARYNKCIKLTLVRYLPVDSPIQDSLHVSPVSEGINLLTIILRSGDEPVLNRAQMHRVVKAHRAHAVYLKQRENLTDSDDDDGPQDEDAWLYEDLRVLAGMYTRLRDREQLISLIFEVNPNP
jgi:hypothetical protein